MTDGPTLLRMWPTAPTIISILALIVSACAFWYTLSARARVQAEVERYVLDGPDPHRDHVNIYNTGRAPAIILMVGAMNEARGLVAAKTMTLPGSDEPVPFPELPMSLPPQGVLRVTFSALHVGPEAGTKYGYGIIYLRPRPLRRAVRDKMIVKFEHPTAKSA